MPVPIICLDARLRQFAGLFRACFSGAQWEHFVTVLLALLLCSGERTLSHLLRQVQGGRSLASVSRFLARSPWDHTHLPPIWTQHVQEQMVPLVQQAHAVQAVARRGKLGRPPVPRVTGYLIGDDSTLHKPRGKQMAGLGRHYSSTAGKPVPGHSLVLSVYHLLGRTCPLAPQLYQTETACATTGTPFASKITLMGQMIRAFQPVPGTQTHVLLDSWYTCKGIWQMARSRGFAITSGLKQNRWVRVPDPTTPQGWRWQQLADYLAGLRDEDFQAVVWPSQGHGRTVQVHVLRTRVRKLYACQVVIVRGADDEHPNAIGCWASSDLDAEVVTLVRHIATRWTIEVVFADLKGVLGLEAYQVMSLVALQRWIMLVLLAYVFLEEWRSQQVTEAASALTIGQARQEVVRWHQRHLLGWLHEHVRRGATPQDLERLLFTA